MADYCLEEEHRKNCRNLVFYLYLIFFKFQFMLILIFLMKIFQLSCRTISDDLKDTDFCCNLTKPHQSRCTSYELPKV